MGKFANLVPHEVPWQYTHKEVVGYRLTLKEAEQVKTQYSPAFLMTCDLVNLNGEPEHNVKILFGGRVLVDQITKLILALSEARDHFPVDVMIGKVRGRNNDYYQIVDPDDIPEGVTF